MFDIQKNVPVEIDFCLLCLQDGRECGDEYLAELDHIEVVEKTKEGYESDVPELSMDVDADDKSSKNDDDIDLSSDDQFGASS